MPYRDPNEVKRTATSISWYPDGAKKLAVAYSLLEFQKHSTETCLDSYIWDIGKYKLSKKSHLKHLHDINALIKKGLLLLTSTIETLVVSADSSVVRFFCIGQMVSDLNHMKK